MSKLLTCIILMVIFFWNISYAFVLLTEEQALQEMLPEVDEIVTETKIVNPEEFAQLKERMGGRLVLFQKGSKSKELAEKNEFTFYFGVKNGEKIGVAIIETQPGKWGPIQYIVALDMVGKIQNLAVMSFVEKRGKPIAKRIFLKQFIGKSSKDKLKIKKDIRAVTGATISSRSAAFAVRKAIALYEELYFNKLVAKQK